MAKLKNLLQEVFEDQESKVNKYEVSEGVRNYAVVGKQLYNNTNIIEIAKQLSHVAESAHSHILGENEDWFDKVSVNRNMKSLKTNVAEFKKAAVEANSLNQRLTALYEDIGQVLNRYYDIDEVVDEALDKVDTSKVEPEDDFKDREDKDIDNDGDSDEEDKYIHNKRQAITKAVKQTKESMDAKPKKRLKDLEMGRVIGIPSLGAIARKIGK